MLRGKTIYLILVGITLLIGISLLALKDIESYVVTDENLLNYVDYINHKKIPFDNLDAQKINMEEEGKCPYLISADYRCSKLYLLNENTYAVDIAVLGKQSGWVKEKELRYERQSDGTLRVKVFRVK